ncbi:MAG: accessory gene regulator B family protein [Firmicutes bacterium]|nr:accessory gene regulator B family protein [Bacillota bacterium]
MTRYLGEGIARHLGRATGLNAEDMEVVAYGLEYLLSAGLGILLTLLAAFLLGLLPETLALLACWILVRRLAGGAHCSTLWRCAAGSCFSAIAAVLISLFAAKSVPVYLWAGAATIWALWATWRWAPNNSKKPVRDPVRRKLLRRRALMVELFLGVAFLLLSLNNSEMLRKMAAAGGGGIASAALMISPAGLFIVNKFDNFCNFLLTLFNKEVKMQ